MKIVTVMFEDSEDISALTEGEVVAISDGTNTVSNGRVLIISKMANPPDPELIAHKHTVGSQETSGANPI